MLRDYKQYRNDFVILIKFTLAINILIHRTMSYVVAVTFWISDGSD